MASCMTASTKQFIGVDIIVVNMLWLDKVFMSTTIVVILIKNVLVCSSDTEVKMRVCMY